ncbi:MAG: hypothetical protein FJ050_08595 [Cyanobacteria bacterium M_surface_7_m2_040]|nr:hypothetical protein [Cyanobacteria bacterium M_surface_7_m2_040]
MASLFDRFRRDGRYRFRAGRSLDPHEELHPEMVGPEVSVGASVPNTPEELMAMQQGDRSEAQRPEKPEKPNKITAKVKQVLDLIHELDTTPGEDQQIALTLVRELEDFHDKVVADLQDDQDAKHSQIAAWAVDADRLMHCRIFLDSIDLEVE